MHLLSPPPQQRSSYQRQRCCTRQWTRYTLLKHMLTVNHPLKQHVLPICHVQLKAASPDHGQVLMRPDHQPSGKSGANRLCMLRSKGLCPALLVPQHRQLHPTEVAANFHIRLRRSDWASVRTPLQHQSHLPGGRLQDRVSNQVLPTAIS